MDTIQRIQGPCAPILLVKINVTASCNELFRGVLMPILGREVERRPDYQLV
jgi:hypothetical protein